MSGLDDTVAATEPSAPAKAPRLAPGTKIGVYRIERVLGEGAMGLVYRATHDSLARQVAVKALKPQAKADSGMVERFLAEARAVNIIRHENIVECTDTFTDEHGETYVVMELLEGTTLREALATAGHMPPGRAVKIAIQIARAIGAAHDKGIVHRDLKPENVFLIRRNDNPDYVKVLDFGIARLRPELGYVTATQTGALIGTPAYMSPEQVSGEKATAVSDVYALGVILFELIAGRGPFRATNIGTMFAAHLVETPKRLDAVAEGTPRALADLVARMLAKPPAERPPSMHEVEAALAQCLPAAEAATVRVVVPPTDGGADTLLSSETSPPRSKWLAIPIVVGLGSAGVAAYYAMQTGTEPSDVPAPGPTVSTVYPRSAAPAPTDAAVVATSPDAALVDARDESMADAERDTSKPGDAKPPGGAKPQRDTSKPKLPSDIPSIESNRAKYDANTIAVAGPNGLYGKGLQKCWGMQRKMNPQLPRTFVTKLGFDIDQQGRASKVTVDPKPDLKRGEHGPDDPLEFFLDCVYDEVSRWKFLAPTFEHTGLSYSIRFTFR